MKQEKKQHNYTVRGIPADQYRALRIAAAKEGISINEMIKRVVQDFLTEE